MLSEFLYSVQTGGINCVSLKTSQYYMEFFGYTSLGRALSKNVRRLSALHLPPGRGEHDRHYERAIQI